GISARDSFNISHCTRAESESSSGADANSVKPTRTATRIPTAFLFMVFRIERVKVTTECVRSLQESIFFLWKSRVRRSRIESQKAASRKRSKINQQRTAQALSRASRLRDGESRTL